MGANVGHTVAILGIVWQSGRSVLTRMLDGVEPDVVDEIRHAADHVKGIEQLLDAKARWNGHRVQADVTIAVDEGMLMASANSIAENVRRELFEHFPALAVANVHFGTVETAEGRGHHAPDPVLVAARLADGLLEIVDTPAGERMRLRVSRHSAGMQATVEIERTGGPEILVLEPVSGDHHHLESRDAPAEPHEFTAMLRLSAGTETEEILFAVAEPTGHAH